MNTDDLKRARTALPGLASCTYLNVGTFGVMAEPVLEQLTALIVKAERFGAPGYEEVRQLVRPARKRLADLVGCLPDELAFTENATHGLNIPAFCLPLGPGDLVLLSGEEYPIAEHIYRWREQHGGPGVRFFKISHDPAETLENVEKAWDDRVRCVLASAVTCETAVRLPVKEICALARRRNAWSFVDVAQAVGQYPVNLHDIGCDFAAGGGHKWLHGPKGVGFFYAKLDRIEDLSPPWVSHTAFRDPVTQEVFIPKNRRRFELVGRHFPYFAAMSAAIDWLESFGWESLWKRAADMRELMCREIEKRPRLRMLSPRNQENSSSLVTFHIAGVDALGVERFVKEAWETKRIYLRASPLTEGIRLSAAYFTTEEDVATFFNHLDSTI